VLPARIALLAARFMSNNQIAKRLGISMDTARKRLGRYAAQSRDGLVDRPRSGRPPTFTPVQVAEVKALGVHGAPLARPGRDQTLATPTLDLYPRPGFPLKARRVLNLYARIWQGNPLVGNEYVISCDETTSIQARCHHPATRQGPHDASQPRLRPWRRTELTCF
jgi:hypothetical protein